MIFASNSDPLWVSRNWLTLVDAQAPPAPSAPRNAGGAARGRIRVIARKNGELLGVSLVGPHAGELKGLWALAISAKLKIGALTGTIAPYPTLGEISKRAAGAWFTPSLFSDRTRRVVRLLQLLLL